jgi:transcriptional regulator PpsR
MQKDAGDHRPLTLFVDLKESLGDFDVSAVSTLIAASGDVVLIIDRDGVIRDVALHNDELARAFDGARAWIGHRWNACVTAESRAKVDALLYEALEKKPPRWVHINHPSPRGAEVPILYTAVQLGSPGHMVAIGRDLRPAAVMQQRLMDTQQAMERDYLHLRHAETRYRLLFETSSEALLVVDPLTRKTLEANRTALGLFANLGRDILKDPFPELFDTNGMQAVDALLALVRTAGRAEEIATKTEGGKLDVSVSASLFRQDNAMLALVRVTPQQSDPAGAVLSDNETILLKSVDAIPDGFVLTGADGRILASNAAFHEMAQIATQEQARASSLDQWLGRPGVDMNVMTATLRQRGSLSLFATMLRGQYGVNIEVEISAASVTMGGHVYFGFMIRNISRRIPVDSRAGRELPRSVDQLTELIGRVPLKDLVREATDMIERLCIQAALELTGDNRASASELLGLSRQSLYVKLRRHGLGDLGEDPESQN